MFYPRNVGEDENPQFWRMAYVSNGLVETNHQLEKNRVVVSNMFYFHPEPWRRFPFWLIFLQMGWFNHQLEKNVVFFFARLYQPQPTRTPFRSTSAFWGRWFRGAGENSQIFWGWMWGELRFFFQGGCLFHSKMYGIIYDFGYKRVIIIGTP